MEEPSNLFGSQSVLQMTRSFGNKKLDGENTENID